MIHLNIFSTFLKYLCRPTPEVLKSFLTYEVTEALDLTTVVTFKGSWAVDLPRREGPDSVAKMLQLYYCEKICFHFQQARCIDIDIYFHFGKNG